MPSNPNRHDHPIRLLDTDVIQESWNAIGDGSNAIILPEKRKRDVKVKGKASNKGNGKQEPKLSKSKQKKLKQLQEEKEKKLLQSECIRNLEKYKLWDGAYSLLHSSGTIGQVKTLKEKRRMAVQFLKAGLEVPEDISPLKKKGDQNASCESDVSLKLDDDQCHPERDGYKDDNVPANRNEVDDCNHIQSVGTYLEPTSKIPLDVQRSRTEEIKYKCTDTRVNDGHKEPTPLLHSQNKGEVVAPQEIHGSSASCQNTDVPNQDHASGPIVVHVTRPKEVEEKRRELPIVMMEQEIMEAVNDGSIVILCGETGCGKTTQVPQFLYEAGYGSRNYSDRKGIIGVTQPRRVAVLATAKRVSFELGFRLGKEVGFQVRHDKMIGDRCSIKFMTDGILLREVQSDFLLKRYSVIILDEAHERSLNTDILIGMLSRIIVLRKKLCMEQQKQMLLGERISPENMISQLKLVLMSATLRVEDFISNRKLFNETPPLVEVPVRQFPVTVHFSKTTQEDYLGQAYKKVMSIHKRLPPGGILVFVTGQREIEYLCKKLRKASNKLTESNSKRNEDTKTNDSLEVDIKDIDDAFDDPQADPFSAYEDDYVDQVLESDSSESDSESEFEDDSEGEEKSGLVLDFQRDSESLSSLKASFEALAKKSDIPISKEGQSSPASPVVEEDKSPGGFYVLPLYAMLPASAQLRVFEEVPEGERLVVVATNVAETSLTIPGIKYVVDTGKEKVKNYNHGTGTATYEVQWISKASSAQRAGRAGRTGPGHCYRLYSSAAFSKDDLFPDFSCPEISKIPVDGVVLLMKFMGIDKVANFPFPTAPETEALVEAERCLKALEALDTEGRLTPLGRAMAQYPMSPRHSRMLLMVIQILRNQPQSYARANLMLGYSVATAAALSFSNPFIMQVSGGLGDTDDTMEKQRKKKVKAAWKESRARLCNPSSDAITAAYALQLFEISKNSVEFCGTHLLHLKTMEEMSKLRRQLLQLVFHHSKLHEEFCWNFGSLEDVERSWRQYCDKNPLRLDEEEILGQAICAGWADRVAMRVRSVSKPSDDNRKVHITRYQSCALKETVYLHRWSSLSRLAPEFIVYTEILHAKRPYMHGATSVKPEWLIKYAGYLCTFSSPLADPKPYYEPLRDETLCWVNPNFGQHNWQLPLHNLPIKNETLRVSVFACALLEGHVLPCVNSAKKCLAAPPSTILRPEALGQRRVGDLLSGLKVVGPRLVDSRVKLREAWDADPRALYSEIRDWFQQGFHDRFGELWEEMQREVLCEGRELFPKRAKKDKRKMKLL